MELFIRGQWFTIKDSEQLSLLMEGTDTERNVQLGKLAYETYCCRLSEHQPVNALTWDRLPPYMKDTWVMVAEVIELYLKDRVCHK